MEFIRVSGTITVKFDGATLGTVSSGENITGQHLRFFDIYDSPYVGSIRDVEFFGNDGTQLSRYLANEGSGSVLTDTGSAGNNLNLTGGYSW